MKVKTILYAATGVILAAAVIYRVLFVHEKVTTAAAARGRLVSLIYATGKVSADDIAVLRCEAGGNVTFLGVREGASVRKGTLLLSSDRTESALKIDQAENEISAAQVDVQDKRKEVDRLSNLLQAHTIPQKEYDAAKKDHDLAQIMLDRRRIMLDQEKKNLTKRTIIAPFDCLVYSVSVNLGDALPPNAECFRVLAPHSIVVEAQVDEQDLSRIAVGRHALVAFDAYAGKKFDAVVTRIVPQTDEATKTSKVILTLSAPPQNLNLGMTATVNIIGQEKDGVLILPKSAIISRNGKSLVLKVVDGRLHETEVTLGINEGTYVEVLAGLTEGTQVVNEPKAALKDNMKVAM